MAENVDHDNAPVHKVYIAQAAIPSSGSEQLNHPLYSRGLASDDYYLFRKLKSHLRGRRCEDHEELTEAGEAWSDQQSDVY